MCFRKIQANQGLSFDALNGQFDAGAVAKLFGRRNGQGDTDRPERRKCGKRLPHYGLFPLKLPVVGNGDERTAVTVRRMRTGRLPVRLVARTAVWMRRP